jgi:hypothetical protein
MDDVMLRLLEISRRKDRFTFDLRGKCQVYSGIVAAYAAPPNIAEADELANAIAHAWEHDGIIGAWKDPQTGKVQYDSCRLFTDLERALRFAEQQQQKAVFNLNRQKEIRLPEAPRSHEPTSAH